MDPGRPTRARYVVLFFLCSMSFVLYLDRVCIGQAVTDIKRDLGIGDGEMSYILAAFTLAYGLFEVPVGRWGDRFGARRTLTRIVVAWSVFTALTGACWNFGSMLVVRFLFGIGEAGAFPNVIRVTTAWFPPEKRGRYRGFFLACSLLGGAAAPALSAQIIAHIGWRGNFAVFGVVGLVWAIAFLLWFRETPAEHPAVNAAERAVIGPPTHASARHDPLPWSLLVRNRNVLLLSLVIICSAALTYFFFSWYPDYLRTVRGVEEKSAGWLASLVLVGSTVGTFLGGFINDRLPTPTGRKLWCAATSALAGALVLAASSAESPEGMSLLFALATASLATFQAIWWGFCADVGGKHVGAVFGFMNGLGALGAMASQILFGQFLAWRHRQGLEGRAAVDDAFTVYAAVLWTAAIAWSLIDTRSLRGEHASQ